MLVRNSNIFVKFYWWRLLRGMKTIDNFWYKFDRPSPLTKTIINIVIINSDSKMWKILIFAVVLLVSVQGK